MDSGNSGSMQSSSGGDEEYDSRPESSVPAFLNTSGHFPPLSSSNPHPSFVSHHHNQQPTFFDPSSNFLNPFSQSSSSNPSSLLNLDVIRPRISLRSDPCTDLGNPMLAPQQGLSTQASFPSSSSSMQQSQSSRSAQDNNGSRSFAQSDHPGVVVKNPKKRTRASRRAPTTVLTTDTSNFRAMVQEFTGIPSPPFSATGSSFSRRFDLFGPGSAIRSTHSLEQTIGPLYPLRPSAHRVHHQLQPTLPFVTSSSSPSMLINPMLDASTSTANINNTTISTSMAATTNNAFNQSMLNMHSHQNSAAALSFQSFLQQPPLHPPPHMPGFGVKSQGSTSGSASASASGSAMPCLDELGMSSGHHHVNANLGGLQLQNHDHQQLRANLDGSYGNSSQRINSSSCKLNYSASSSDFHNEKGLENVSSRAEGTVDSWICPQD